MAFTACLTDLPRTGRAAIDGWAFGMRRHDRRKASKTSRFPPPSCCSVSDWSMHSRYLHLTMTTAPGQQPLHSARDSSGGVVHSHTWSINSYSDETIRLVWPDGPLDGSELPFLHDSTPLFDLTLGPGPYTYVDTALCEETKFLFPVVSLKACMSSRQPIHTWREAVRSFSTTLEPFLC